jgi:hypothetical protein
MFLKPFLVVYFKELFNTDLIVAFLADAAPFVNKISNAPENKK